VLAVLLMLAALVSPCRALALPRISLVVASCDGLDDIEVRRLLATELVGIAVLTSAPPSLEVTRASVDCDIGGVAVRVDDALTHKLLTRHVSLLRVDAKAQARVLAIAVGELLRASWLELSGAAAPASTPAPRRRPPATPKGAARFSVGVGPVQHWFVNGVGPLLGGLLLGRAEVVPRLPLETGVSLVGGSETIHNGRARILLGSAQLGLGFRLRTAPIELDGFASTRLGWVNARGEPGNPLQTVSRDLLLPWMGAGGGICASWALGPAFVALRVEAGYTLASVAGKVDTTRELALSGAFLASALVVGLGR
jgi:hypothetical protein